MKLNQRPSKIWIYAPLYVLLACMLSAGTWRMMNPKKAQIAKVVETTKDEVAAEPKRPDCFNAYCRGQSGLFDLWPRAEIRAAYAQLDEGCADRLCLFCEEEEDGLSEEVFSEDPCLSRLFEQAKDYHIDRLAELPLTALFYNSGVTALTQAQRRELELFLRPYRKLSDSQGIVIIGRASKGGSEATNERLSRQRATTIQGVLTEVLGPEFKTDYAYFGAKPPQLDLETAQTIDIDPALYERVRVTAAIRKDHSLQLNQSVIVVIYGLEEDVFGLEE